MVTKAGVLLDSDPHWPARYVPESHLKHKVPHCGQRKEISRSFAVHHRQMFCKCCMKKKVLIGWIAAAGCRAWG
jgi:hypothetical protein